MDSQHKVIHHETEEAVSMHILIVDDDQDILEALKDIVELEIESCVVEIANNIEKARLLAEKTKPDIALLDIKIGQDNGLELIQTLKSISHDVACIMMTAYRDNDYTIAAVRLGADDYLFKPVKPMELIRTVKRLFNEQLAKRKIEVAENRFVTVFEQATQWLFILDRESKLIDANQIAMDFIEKDKADIIGLNFSDSPWYEFSVEAKKCIEKGLQDVAAGDLYHAEIKLFDRKQNVNFFDFYMKPVFNSENEVEQIVVESRNITDKKLADDKLKYLNEKLELRVKERTLQLEKSLLLLTEENKERKKAEQQAKKASDAKSDFLSRMSHELRTPMNAILGFGQLLEYDLDDLDQNQQTYVKEILDAGEHLLSLINQVLDLTEIESGKLDITLNEVKLDDVIQQCTSMIQPLAEKRQLKQIDHISDKGYHVKADFIRLKQVVLNLLSNAVKYNRDGGSIILDSEIINDDRLRITITDTGDGIAQDDIDKLFNSFERLNTQFNVEGTGIGLVITKNLIELMGGAIGVESTPGEGSTFWVEIALVTHI